MHTHAHLHTRKNIQNYKYPYIQFSHANTNNHYWSHNDHDTDISIQQIAFSYHQYKTEKERAAALNTNSILCFLPLWAQSPDKVQYKIVCSPPTPIYCSSVTNANERCTLEGGVSTADEGGSKHVRVPIIEVLLLPSGHHWPFDPSYGLNVKGHQPGSVWITESPRPGMHPHGNTWLDVGGEMWVFSILYAKKKMHTETPYIMLSIMLLFLFPVNTQLDGNLKKPGMKTDKPHPQLPLADIRGHILAGILAQNCDKKGHVLYVGYIQYINEELHLGNKGRKIYNLRCR